MAEHLPPSRRQQAAAEHDPYAALRFADYRLFLSGNILATVGMQMQTVAVQWEIYQRTQSAWMLGLVGLAQVVPVLALTFVVGHVVDRYDRKRVVMMALAVLVLASLGLACLSHWQGPIPAIYGCLFLIGVARAFQQPAKASLVPHLLSREAFPNAVAWNTSGFHLASIGGPALGGFLIAWFDVVPVYVCDVALTSSFLVLLLLIRRRPTAARTEPMTLESLAAGVVFVWQNKVLLGAMTLDMFAVLLGGATALLPIFSEGILGVGAEGLGWLRAAPAVGALLMAFVIAHRPPMEHAGRALLWSVVGFGAATIVFGLSTSFTLSFVMLFLTGALDNISVVVRHTLVQLLTPDSMRGRVSAVNSMFIGASNELGGFESGTVARLFGAVFSVVSGGIGTLVVVGVVARFLPDLRNYGRLDGMAKTPQPKPTIDDVEVPATPEENVWAP